MKYKRRLYKRDIIELSFAINMCNNFVKHLIWFYYHVINQRSTITEHSKPYAMKKIEQTLYEVFVNTNNKKENNGINQQI